MKKLKNTTTNKLMVVAGLTALGYLGGTLLTKKGASNRKTMGIVGAVIGLAVSQGVMSRVVEPKKEATSNAAGEVCNKNRSNKPCLDWVIGKGWTNIKK
jgi:hypothetical protein